MAKIKTHFVFPEEILKDIDRLVGNRKRSRFVVEAAKEKLEKERLGKALKEAKGLWKNEDYSEFKTIDNINEWIDKHRSIA